MIIILLILFLLSHDLSPEIPKNARNSYNDIAMDIAYWKEFEKPKEFVFETTFTYDFKKQNVLYYAYCLNHKEFTLIGFYSENDKKYYYDSQILNLTKR